MPELVPSMGMYTNVIQTCTRNDKWASALRVFDEALIVLNASYAPSPPQVSVSSKSRSDGNDAET